MFAIPKLAYVKWVPDIKRPCIHISLASFGYTINKKGFVDEKYNLIVEVTEAKSNRTVQSHTANS